MKRIANTINLLIIIALLQASFSFASARRIRMGVSENTPVAIVAEWPIGASTQLGEHFSARIVEDVVSSSGEIFIAKNSRVVGRVVDLKTAGAFHRNGKVDIRFEQIIFPDNVTTLNIRADGKLEKTGKPLKAIGEALGAVAVGAAKGAILGFKFGGIVATGTSAATNLAIGAAGGAGISLISFISKKGRNVEINPGLPMTLNILDMQKQDYMAQQIHKPDQVTRVNAEIIKTKENKLTISIKNDLRHSIPLTNLKIIDGLGYTVKPNISYGYFDTKSIPAKSNDVYDFEFNPLHKSSRYWLVLTDSFGKQEYFRQEIVQ